MKDNSPSNMSGADEKQSSSRQKLDRDLTILLDYRGAFYQANHNKFGLNSFDIARLERLFSRKGWNPVFLKMHEVDFDVDWKDKIVLYQSDHDIEHYRSFIEDILLGLSLAGAKLVPEFPFLRAHHNKVFMEILRKVVKIPQLNTLQTRVYGTAEDFFQSRPDFPVVIKPSAGSLSSGIVCLKSMNEAHTKLRKLTRVPLNLAFFKELAKRRLRPVHVDFSLYRNKFVSQELIPDLTHDYKVLVFGKKYYALRRSVRKNDFRASGSGLVSWPERLPEGLLDFSREVKELLNVPIASFDIAESNGGFHMIEMQFVQFGTTGLEFSKFHWIKSGDSWVMVEEEPDLEATFVTAIDEHLSKT